LSTREDLEFIEAMASSLQGALSVARPPEVSRFGTFVKPTVDWF
jgi:hypothetical protein